MFHPVGSQPPSVYWRRRVAFLGTLLILIVLVVVTARVLLSGDGAAAPPAGQGSSSALTSTDSSAPSSTASSTAQHTSAPASGTDSTSSTAGSSTASAPQHCDRSKLDVRAVSDHTSYQVGDQPKLMLQVTDTAKTSCVQDLADPQIELRVYNGESRVWGSHDCKVLHQTHDMTLLPNAPVRITIVWSGQSSRANTAHTEDACGPRQVVGAGTYTLYAYLAGKPGSASQFSIS